MAWLGYHPLPSVDANKRLIKAKPTLSLKLASGQYPYKDTHKLD